MLEAQIWAKKIPGKRSRPRHGCKTTGFVQIHAIRVGCHAKIRVGLIPHCPRGIRFITASIHQISIIIIIIIACIYIYIFMVHHLVAIQESEQEQEQA